jgi:manganese/iron transport system ATP-binding protein
MVQRSEVDWAFPVNVSDVVMMGRIRQMGFFHKSKPADRAFVRGCLERVGLQDLARRQIGELSGGQQQRMFIARALAQQAELMLMDEPFTGLDLTTQEGILSLLAELSRSRVTVMVATHDLNLAAQHFDRVLLLNRNAVACGPAAEVFTQATLSATFGGHAHTIPTRDGLILVNDTCCSGGRPNA